MNVAHSKYYRWINFTWGLPLWFSCKESVCNAGDVSSIPGLGRSLEKEMATYSSALAWEIPWTEEPGGLQSIVSQSQTRRRDEHTHTHNQDNTAVLRFPGRREVSCASSLEWVLFFLLCIKAWGYHIFSASTLPWPLQQYTPHHLTYLFYECQLKVCNLDAWLGSLPLSIVNKCSAFEFFHPTMFF